MPFIRRSSFMVHTIEAVGGDIVLLYAYFFYMFARHDIWTFVLISCLCFYICNYLLGDKSHRSQRCLL